MLHNNKNGDGDGDGSGDSKLIGFSLIAEFTCYV